MPKCHVISYFRMEIERQREDYNSLVVIITSRPSQVGYQLNLECDLDTERPSWSMHSSLNNVQHILFSVSILNYKPLPYFTQM